MVRAKSGKEPIMAKNIKGNRDGADGENNTYNISGRGKSIPRDILVKEIKQGKHPDYIVTKIEGKEYVKSKPNSSEKDNVN